MAGYIYCMQNDHRRYGMLLKIGYTERSPEIRRVQLCTEWRCKFEILWDLHLYEPARAESFLHEVFSKFRVEYEFFKMDSEIAKQLAEQIFDEHWREIEGKEITPPSLVELADRDAQGVLLEPEQSPYDPDLDPYTD